MTQDAPPTPQHRVGTIGGRPSQSHDATTSRSPFITHSGLTLPSGANPGRTTQQPAPATTPWSPAPAPPAPGADVAEPRAGASECSEDRRRWEPPGPSPEIASSRRVSALQGTNALASCAYKCRGRTRGRPFWGGTAKAKGPPGTGGVHIFRWEADVAGISANPSTLPKGTPFGTRGRWLRTGWRLVCSSHQDLMLQEILLS